VIDALVLTRWIHFAASLFAAGTVSFAVLVAQPAATMSGAGLARLHRRWRLWVWSALAIAFVSGVTWLLLVSADILGLSIVDAGVNGGAWSVLRETRFGTVLSVRLLLGAFTAALILWRRTNVLSLAAAAGFVASLAWIGHAGAATGPAANVHLASDVTHLLAAAAWLGGLPALALLLAGSRKAAVPDGVAARATARFSWLGMVSVAVLLATGIANSWFLLSGPRDLWANPYGRLVLLKVLLFAAMVGIAAVNRFRLTPRLPAASALRALQRNSLTETGLGLVVLFVVGAMGTMEPANHVHPMTASVPPDAAYVHIHTNEAMADLTITPGKAGSADVNIRLLRGDFTALPVKSVRLALDPPAHQGPSVERGAIPADDGAWKIAAFAIDRPGVWTARVIVTPMSGPPIVLDAPVMIEPQVQHE
jgi:putative copper resistance protein D